MIKSHLYAIQFTRYSVVSLGLAELLYSTMLSSVCQVLFSNSFEFVLFLVKLHRFARYFVGRSLERSDILPRPLPFVKRFFPVFEKTFSGIQIRRFPFRYGEPKPSFMQLFGSFPPAVGFVADLF